MIAVETIEAELYERYYGQFHQILNEDIKDQYALEVDLYDYFQFNSYLVSVLRKNPMRYLELFDQGNSM
jgi:hypothetical protein